MNSRQEVKLTFSAVRVQAVFQSFRLRFPLHESLSSSSSIASSSRGSFAVGLSCQFYGDSIGARTAHIWRAIETITTRGCSRPAMADELFDTVQQRLPTSQLVHAHIVLEPETFHSSTSHS